jgi:hypothetical protein
MSAIEQIKELVKYLTLDCKIEDNTISVEPGTALGFTVWLTEETSGYTVGFDGWHEIFDCEEEALKCFAFGLSDVCRLKVIKRGSRVCSWTMESREGEEWVKDSVTGLFFVQFWKKKRIEYLSNSVIKSSE